MKKRNEFREAAKVLGFGRLRWDDAGDAKALEEALAKVKELEETNKTQTGQLKELQDEVLTDEYLDFLGDKKEPKKKVEEKPKKDDTDYEGMSKKDMLALAEKNVTEKFQKQFDELKEGIQTDKKNETKSLVTSFAKQHEDFETYKPMMYGISTEGKFKESSLSELYKEAKDRIHGIKTGIDDEEKKRQEKLESEKPGGASDSVSKEETARLEKMTGDEISAETLKEVKEELGPIPAA